MLVRVGRLMLLLALVVSCPLAAQAQDMHPLTVDDLLALEQLDPVVEVSPDGEWLAVGITRPMAPGEIFQDFLYGRDRADIWLISRRTGERRRITDGAADGSGYWNPSWSPDGKRLALLSTQGGDDVRPYVWEMATGTLRRLTERVADLDALGDGDWSLPYPFVWRDSTTVLCPVGPEGAPTGLNASYQMVKTRSRAIAQREWLRSLQGLEPTASILESGREIPEAERPQGALLAIDTRTGVVRAVVQGNVRRVLLSPTNRHLAVILESGTIPPQPLRSLPLERPDRGNEGYFGVMRTRLAILSLDDLADVIHLGEVLDPKVVQAEWATPYRWSPNGSTFAVIAKRTKDDETATVLSLVSVTTRTAAAAAPELDVAAAAWSAGGELLALGRPRPQTERPNTTRYDWWTIDPTHKRPPLKLTADLDVAPPYLLRIPDRHSVVGIASGKLWLLDTRTGQARDQTRGAPPIASVVRPTRVERRGGEGLLVMTESGDLYRVVATGGDVHVEPFPRPSVDARLATFLPERQLTVFTAAQRDGSFLWTGDGVSKRFELRLSLNQALGQIQDAKRMLITYRGVDGDTLTGLVILPIGYRQGQRYPLVTWVYAEDVVTDTLNTECYFEKQCPLPYNLHLLAAHGYAVLIPSMPLEPRGQASDPAMDLPKGVIAAVDKVIDLGIADPGRLGVMGLSYGGYSVFAIATYTHRFNAGVAIAGITDLVSDYGTTSLPGRYGGYAHEDMGPARMAETGQMRMGGPPWRDLWRYLRNSPIGYVERVQTPLMIIHGDLDPVPLQQSEEFFTALYRLGKEAKFIRYWGEPHGVTSPANIRHMWEQIFLWFDVHLKAQSSGEHSAALPPLESH